MQARRQFRDVTMDKHVLECRICYLPLKPLIFQCGVEHVLCSSCSEILKDAGKCYLCGVAMPGGYRRCHGMEDVMNSIRVPCPHAPYGCDARPVYHARWEHFLECHHEPCHCPGDGCTFVGSVTTLVEHLTGEHGRPCTGEVHADVPFVVALRDGFNFLTAVRGNAKYLLLLNMKCTPFGRAISVVWIRSLAAMAIHTSAPVMTRINKTCDLKLTFSHYKDALGTHFLYSRFRVACLSPLNGLPDPNVTFQFLVPKYVGGSNEAIISLTAEISIIPSDQADGPST